MRYLASIILILLLCPFVQAENLFIMGWDGAGMVNVQRLVEEGKLPNLQRFIDEGNCLMPLEGLGATSTVPNWTTIFTGLSPDQSGVSGNKKYNGGTLNIAYNNNLYEGVTFWVNYVPFYNTILKPIQDQGHAVGWFVSKGLLTTNAALYRICVKADKCKMRPPDPYGDPYIDWLGNSVLYFITTNNDFVIFFHTNPDWYGHYYGENSNKYTQEFIRSDRWLGVILNAINRENTKVIVISDHGFDKGQKSHYNAPDLFWATDLPVKETYCNREAIATTRDIATTILDYYGVDYKARVPQMRGKSVLRSE